MRRLRLHVLAEIALGAGIILLVAWLGIMVPGVAAGLHQHTH